MSGPDYIAHTASCCGGWPTLGWIEFWRDAELAESTLPADCVPPSDGKPLSADTEAIRVLVRAAVRENELLAVLLAETGEIRLQEKRLGPPRTRKQLYTWEANTPDPSGASTN